jgi:hypothetical protein
LAGEAKIAILARDDTLYLRRVVTRLVKLEIPPTAIFLGSSTERTLSKIDSLRAMRAQLGTLEAVKRLIGRNNHSEPILDCNPSLKEIADKDGITLLPYDRINEGSLSQYLIGGSYLSLLAGAGIIDKSVILASRMGCLNAHPAILPGLRGMDVVDWALLENLPIGISVHFVAAKIDAGPIVATKRLAPNPAETYLQFHSRIRKTQAELLAEAAADVFHGRAQLSDHDLARSTLKYRMPSALRAQALEAYVRYRAASSQSADNPVDQLNSPVHARD